ncbi:MAG: phosphoglucosamine mutase [Bacteroidales bacterium]|nr:phosphoglucosamine mutase [Bacteroidales bacterium]
MTLIKSISGIRGTIGGAPGEGLTPIDIVKFSYAYCKWLTGRGHAAEGRYKVVVGRDARLSGSMVEDLVCGTLVSCGVDVINAGLASTPTTEMAVILSGADGGIILTASHNPKQWNALKLLNEKGEFLTAEQGNRILELAESGDFEFAAVDKLGKVTEHDFTDAHLDAVTALEAVDAAAIRKASFKVVLDAVNSVGGIIMPELLERLGVECICINCEPTGDFVHNPEPLPANLTGLSEAVVRYGADLGISVDPDVDRLAFICETGEPFVEEYTLVSIADYLLRREEERGVRGMATVSNLSSSRALRDVTESHGGVWYPAAVGEVNVTTRMHEVGALIGGEGNGGVIYPAIHSGRDAMVGVALFLSNLAGLGISASALKASLPQYFIAKNRIELDDPRLTDLILDAAKTAFPGGKVNTVDGVKIDFDDRREWIHFRRSNTEPVIRIYSEAMTVERAEELGGVAVSLANSIIRQCSVSVRHP